MGEVVPGECMTNALYEGNWVRILSSLDHSWEQLAWESMLELVAVGHTMGMSVPTVEPMREGEEEEEEEDGKGMEEDRRKGSSSTGDLVPGWVPVLQCAMVAAPGS